MALKKTNAGNQASEVFDRLPDPKKAKQPREKEKLHPVTFRILKSDYELLVDYCWNEYGLKAGEALRFAINDFIKRHGMR